jgi:hypothetical protein
VFEKLWSHAITRGARDRLTVPVQEKMMAPIGADAGGIAPVGRKAPVVMAVSAPRAHPGATMARVARDPLMDPAARAIPRGPVAMMGLAVRAIPVGPVATMGLAARAIPVGRVATMGLGARAMPADPVVTMGLGARAMPADPVVTMGIGARAMPADPVVTMGLAATPDPVRMGPEMAEAGLAESSASATRISLLLSRRGAKEAIAEDGPRIAGANTTAPPRAVRLRLRPSKS